MREAYKHPHKVRRVGQNWYAEKWQARFHYFADGNSLCGKYWLAEGVPRDHFDLAKDIPSPLRCKRCLKKLAKKK